MVMRRLTLAAVVALVWAGAASAATPQQLTVTASDGTSLACAVVIPDGTMPAGGWPGVILFHGLGGSYADMLPIAEQAFAPAGLASLACDARGTHASGGTFGLDGPAEDRDAQDLYTWFAARDDVSDTQIGAFGISLGGGAVWNATAAGVPFKAIVAAISVDATSTRRSHRRTCRRPASSPCSRSRCRKRALGSGARR